MTVSERVKQACKERHIPVSKIEQHFGFSNGYIAQMKDEFVPYDRIAKIADYLGTSIQYLMTGQEYYTNLGTADAAQELYDSELQGLMDAARDCPPEVIRSLKDLALQFKETNRDG